MPNMNVIDKDGEWVVNRALFRMVDPTHGEGAEIILEPGIPTKVKKTEWMQAQGEIIADCPDPLTSDEPIPRMINPVENNLVPKDEKSGEAKPDASPGIAGPRAKAERAHARK